MNTQNLFNSYVCRINPPIIAVNDNIKNTDNIDCCLISEYSGPADLWDKLTQAIARSNTYGTIFIDTMCEICPGSTLPYSATLALMACATGIDIDINTVKTNPNSTIILQVFDKGIQLKRSLLDSLDFSRFNTRLVSNTLCGTLNMVRYNDIPWIRSAIDTNPYTGDGTIDVVFTLAGADSPTNNDELRIALRSIARHAKDLGTIWIVTDNPPPWITNVKIIEVSDSFKNNKDANLITKVLAACSRPELSDRFIYWSDDQVLTQDISLKDMLPVYNNRGIDCFSDPRSKWAARMHNTLMTVKAYGGDVSCNWDSHVPQPIDKDKFSHIMRGLDFAKLPGLCINTAYFGVKGETPRCHQESVKRTYENDRCTSYEFDKIFVGYNDAGYNSGLREALFERFDAPCKYEKK